MAVLIAVAVVGFVLHGGAGPKADHNPTEAAYRAQLRQHFPRAQEQSDSALDAVHAAECADQTLDTSTGDALRVHGVATAADEGFVIGLSQTLCPYVHP